MNKLRGAVLGVSRTIRISIASVALLVAGAARGDAEDAVTPQPASALIKCLRTDHIGTVEPLSAKLVLLHGAVGRTVWVSRLRQACTGLRPTSKVLLGGGALGNEICSGDGFSYVNSVGGASSGRGGLNHEYGADDFTSNRCVFGMFEKVTPEQVEMLRQAEKPN